MRSSMSQGESEGAQLQSKTLLLLALLLLLSINALSDFDNNGVAGFDESTRINLEEVGKNALIVFGTARVINGVVSVLQEAEVGAKLGVGVSMQPGQILDPLNDLIERFSLVMLTSATVVYSQMFLLDLFSSVTYQWVLSAFILFYALFIVFAYPAPGRFQRVFTQLLMLLVLLRFFIPVTGYASHAFHRSFESVQADTQQAVDAAKQDLEKLRGQDDDDSWFVSKVYKSAQDLFGYANNVYGQFGNEIGGTADSMAQGVIKLIALFVLKTIVIPLFSLWLLYWLTRSLALVMIAETRSGAHG